MPILPGILAGKIKPTTDWFRVFNGFEAVRDVSGIDSSNNSYSLGHTSGTNSLFIAEKLNEFGETQWQRTTPRVRAGDIDSGNNFYYAATTSTNNQLVVKMNTNGSQQWARQLTVSSTNDSRITVHTANDNVYACTWITNTVIIWKYNSAGTLQWQRTYGLNGVQANGVATDSTESVYIVGRYNTTSTDINPFIIKYNSAGTLQWERFVSGPNTSASESFQAIAIDSADGIYCLGRVVLPLETPYIVKYNTSGDIQWQRTLDGTGNSGDSNARIAVDSSNNVYITQRIVLTGSSNGDLVVAKYNSSGTLQFQRSIKVADAVEESAFGINIASNNRMIIRGARNYGFTWSLPTDGTKTGTYTAGALTMTYAASSATDTSRTYAAGTPAGTATTPGYGETTGTFTDAAVTAGAAIKYF